ncbi:MAG: helix-turn-helix domain-containing protein [Candidatus Bathyarchaeia archaeon]
MSGKDTVKVHLEIGDLKVDFEGDSKQVFESLLRFLSQVCPNIELLQKITYAPDLVNLMNNIAGLVEISSEGPLINLNLDLSTRNAICLALLGAYIGNRIGKLSKDTLSISELSKLTGKAKKTVTNEMPKLIENGLVERVYEGEYRITELGIRRTEDIIKAVKGV